MTTLTVVAGAWVVGLPAFLVVWLLIDRERQLSYATVIAIAAALSAVALVYSNIPTNEEVAKIYGESF